jgi:hypothetical protein
VGGGGGGWGEPGGELTAAGRARMGDRSCGCKERMDKGGAVMVENKGKGEDK